MDRSDKKTSEFERRASRRMSRAISIHPGGDIADAVNDDAYMAAMAMTVTDGFRPSTETTATTAAASGASHSLSLPTSKDADHSRRPSVSSISHDDDDLSATGTALEAPSISSDASSSSSSSSSSSCSSSYAGASSSSSPSQPSAVPVSVELPQEPTVLSASAQPRSTVVPRPSSIAKPPIESPSHPGAISLHDASGGSSSSRNHPVADVRASSSSSVPPAQEEEPYQGPSGPSFPYQMYPQNVRMARTLSGVTTSTAAQSDSSYTGPRGPTFPYGLYPQNAIAGPSTVPGAGIPVGFPGMADNYQRRIGPEGEDIADMIGPDGHTEQLPPYSRYPDEAYTRKIAAANETPHPDPLAGPMMAQSSVPVAGLFPNTVPVAAPEPMPAVPAVPATAPTTAHAAIPAALQPIPGAGGIGLASRNPEFDGAEDVESPRSRYSLRSFNSDGSGHEINTAARGMSEKRRVPNFVQRYGGRRILGIVPYWAICLVLTALLLMGIILGSVVGTFLARHRKAQQEHHSNSGPVSITVTVDATPIPTPANLPSLPTGTFNLPLQKDEGPGACFNDTTQAQAWSCNIPYQYGMTVTINSLIPTPDGPMYNISINCNESATVQNNVFYYGEQAPVITTPMSLQLVNDTLDPNRGPAWFKMLPYNKTVVVPETFLSVPNASPTASANQKRDSAEVEGSLSFAAAGPFHRKGVVPAQAGDKPWVCTWPDTILEVFIYPNQNTSMYKISLSSTYTPSTATPTPTPSPSPATGISVNGAAVTSTPPSTTTGTASGASSTPSQFPDMPPLPPPYPRVVKVEERRMANSPQATCVQYELKPEGTSLKAVPNLDANGKIIEITISELESGPSLFSQSRRDIISGDEIFEKRDVSGLSKCGCLWMVT